MCLHLNGIFVQMLVVIEFGGETSFWPTKKYPGVDTSLLSTLLFTGRSGLAKVA